MSISVESLSGLDGKELADALLRRAEIANDDEHRADLYHQAGLAAELRANDITLAMRCYSLALDSNPTHSASNNAILGLQESLDFSKDGIEGEKLSKNADHDEVVETLLAMAERRIVTGDLEAARRDLDTLFEIEPENFLGCLLEQEICASSPDLGDRRAGVEAVARRMADTTLDESLKAAAKTLSSRLAVAAEPSQARMVAFKEAVQWPGDDVGALWAYQRAASKAPAMGRDRIDSLVRETSNAEGPLEIGAALNAAVAMAWSEGQPRAGMSLLTKTVLDSSGCDLEVNVGLEVAAHLAKIFGDASELPLLKALAKVATSAPSQAAIFTRIGQLVADENLESDEIVGEKALRYFEAALEAVPSYKQASDKLAILHQDAVFPQKARDLLRQRGEHEGRADLMLEAAEMTLVRLERRDEAIVLLRQAISLSDESDLLGPSSAIDQLERYLGDSEEGTRALRQVLEESLSSCSSKRAKALLLRKIIKRSEDEEVIESARRRLVEVDSDDFYEMERLAELYARQGRWAELGELRRRELDHFEARKEDERSLEVMYSLGRLCQIALADEESALGWYRTMLEKSPGDLSALAAAGRILVSDQRWIELAELYAGELSSVQDSAKEASMAFRLATLYERILGDQATARVLYERVRRLNSNHLPSLFGLVRVATATKDWELWIKLVREWSERERDDVLAGTLSCELAYVLETHMGDLVAANEAYERSMELLPKLELARLGRIRCLYRLGRWKEAANLTRHRQHIKSDEENDEDRLDKLLAVTLLGGAETKDVDALLMAFPDNRLGRLAAMRDALMGGDGEAAAHHALKLANGMPHGDVQDAMGRFAGILARMAGEDEAVALSTLADQPMDEMSLLRLEASFREKNDLGELGSVMQQRAALAKTDLDKAVYISAYGRILQAKGDSELAADAYRSSLKIQPDFVPSAKALKLLNELIGDREGLAVAAEYEGSIARDPKMAVQDFLVAGDLRRRQLGDIKGAIQDLENALRIDPTEKDAFEFLREIYSLQGEDKRLFELLSRRAESLLDSEEKKELLLIMAQVSFNRLRDKDLSIECHQKVLAVDPEHVQSMRILAELYQSSGRWQESIKSLKRVVGCTRDKNLLAMTMQAIAELYDKKLADPIGAIDAYIAMMNHNPNHILSLQRLGELLVEEARWDDAARVYGRLLQIERRRVPLTNALKTLAIICQRGLADSEKAMQCLKQAAKLDPHDMDVHKAIYELCVREGRESDREKHLLDALRSFSAALGEDLRNPKLLDGLAVVSRWRENSDRVFCAATMVEAVGAPDDAQLQELRNGRRRGKVLPSEVIPIQKTARAIPVELSSSVLFLLRAGRSVIDQFFAPDPRTLGLKRRTRLAERSSRPGAQVALKWPRLFSLTNAEVHVLPDSVDGPLAFMHQDQVMVVVGADCLDALGEGDEEALFRLGLALAPISMGIGSFGSMVPDAFIASVAAIVRQSSSDFLVVDGRGEHPRVNPAVVRRYFEGRGDANLASHSLTVSGRFDAQGLLLQWSFLRRAVERLALIPVSDPASPLKFVDERDGESGVNGLLRFMLEDSFFELREAIGVAR